MPLTLTDVDAEIATVIAAAIHDPLQVAFIARSREAAILRFDSVGRAIPREAINKERRTPQDERIDLLNGISFRFFSARRYGGLRGYSLDLAVIDSDAEQVDPRELHYALLVRSGRQIEVAPL